MLCTAPWKRLVAAAERGRWCTPISFLALSSRGPQPTTVPLNAKPLPRPTPGKEPGRRRRRVQRGPGAGGAAQGAAQAGKKDYQGLGVEKLGAPSFFYGNPCNRFIKGNMRRTARHGTALKLGPPMQGARSSRTGQTWSRPWPPKSTAGECTVDGGEWAGAVSGSAGVCPTQHMAGSLLLRTFVPLGSSGWLKGMHRLLAPIAGASGSAVEGAAQRGMSDQRPT